MSAAEGALPVRSGLVIPADELSVSTSRSGGPCGQHLNQLETKVTVPWIVRSSRVLNVTWRARLLEKLASRITDDGELVIHASSERSQSANRFDARRRLAELVDEGLKVPKKRRATKPTKGSKRRRLKAKKQRSDTKRLRRGPGRDD